MKKNNTQRVCIYSNRRSQCDWVFTYPHTQNIASATELSRVCSLACLFDFVLFFFLYSSTSSTSTTSSSLLLNFMSWASLWYNLSYIYTKKYQHTCAFTQNAIKCGIERALLRCVFESVWAGVRETWLVCYYCLYFVRILLWLCSFFLCIYISNSHISIYTFLFYWPVVIFWMCFCLSIIFVFYSLLKSARNVENK